MAFLTEAANRGSVSTGYEISNSLLLDNSNSSMEYNHHQMSPGGDDQWSAQSNAGTNSKKATLSLWIKRARLSPSSGAGQYARLFQFQTGGNATSLYFVTDQLTMYDDVTSASLKTNRRFRDTSAWYHIVLAMDSTQATAANRVKLYVNGEQQTDWATEDYGNQNSDLAMFSATNIVWYLGCAAGNGQGYTFDGYMTEFHFVDGAQKVASDFGEYDEDSGIWIPKQYTGGYGTLGCYYNFEDTSNNRFNDESGNGNFMNNRGGSFEGEITTDTPTNNFCTPFVDQYYNSTDDITHTEGGSKLTTGVGTGWRTNQTTVSLSSGKWYAEFKHPGTIDGDAIMTSIVPTARFGASAYAGFYGGQSSGDGIGWYWDSTRFRYDDGTTITPPQNTVSSGDILGIALDMDNNYVYSRINGGSWHNNGSANGDPTSGSSGTGGFAVADEPHMICVSMYHPNKTFHVNFGGYASYTISSGATDENGYGTFEYAPPTGYYAICTQNLAEYG